jgi:hypothetical protein
MFIDNLTHEGAQRLASKLRSFWRESPTVEIRVEASGRDRSGIIFIIRSNLANGLPPAAIVAADATDAMVML